MAKDFYEILGVKRNASDDDIKRAYRKLARKYHPDVNPGDKAAETKFKEISEAYNVLGEPEKRKKYDHLGPDGFRMGFDPTTYGYSKRGPGGFGGFDFGGFDSGGRSGGFEDIFSEILGRGARRKPRGPEKGNDIHYTMEIDFQDAMKGVSTQINLNRGDRTEKISVKIPPGVDNGSKVRVVEKGEEGINRGPKGDLYIITKVRPSRIFERKKENIYCNVNVPFYDAALGSKISVPTIDGSTQMTVPAGSQGGQIFRLKGKGAPKLKKGGRGDQFVTFQISVPKNLTPEQQELLEEFKKTVKTTKSAKAD